MKRTVIAAVALGLAWTAAARAQRQEHEALPQTPAASTPALESCLTAQRQVVALADLINGRVEEARQSNSPQAMRSALADVQAALVEMRTRASACSPLAAAAQPGGDPHAGHAMPAATALPAGAARQPDDPHAGHAAQTPAKPPPPSKPAPSERKDGTDPVCGKTVDPAKAPSATYKGKTYYFCSAGDRLRFIRNPETYLKKQPGKQ